MRILMIALFSISMMAAACKKKENKETGTAAKPADTTGSAPGSAPGTAHAHPPDCDCSACAAAAHGSAPGSAPTTGTTGAAASGDMEAQGVAMMEKMHTVFKDAGEDCEKFATDMRKFMDENKDTMVKLAEWNKTQTPEQKKAFDEKYKGKEEEMKKVMMPLIMKCKDNKNVQAVMQDMGKMMEGK